MVIIKGGPIGAIVCTLVCAICLFVALERNSQNAANVEAFNQIGGDMLRANLKPSMPTASKYALFFALLAGAGAIIFVASAAKQRSQD